MRTIHFLLILSAVTSSAFAGGHEQAEPGKPTLAIGWDANPKGRIKAIGDPIEQGEGNALIGPLNDDKVFAGAVDAKKSFVGVEVSFKIPKKGDYRLECDIKHEPQQGEPADKAFRLQARRMKAGQWDKPFRPTLERHKGPLYTLKADLKSPTPGVENRMVFASSKSMRFKGCVVVPDDGLGATAGGSSSSSRRQAR